MQPGGRQGRFSEIAEHFRAIAEIETRTWPRFPRGLSETGKEGHLVPGRLHKIVSGILVCGYICVEERGNAQVCIRLRSSLSALHRAGMDPGI